MAGHLGDSNIDKMTSQELKRSQKDERRAAIMKNYSCKKNPYENGRLLDPDGNLLSYTDLKKG